MKIFALLCRFVDWDFRRKPITTAGNLNLLIGMLPWLGLALIDQQANTRTPPSILAVVIAADVGWFSFVGWRGWRLFRQFAARSDRLYDRRGKHLLPPEYRGRESATKARRRRKNVR
jgi:hypothetical protein